MVFRTMVLMLGLTSCAQEPGELENGAGGGAAGELEFCESFYWSESGGTSDTPRQRVWEGRCAIGAVCGAGLGYFVCPPDEVPENWSLTTNAEEWTPHPTYPACDGSGEDGCSLCFFEPGCPATGGRCAHGFILLPGPDYVCQSQDCMTYCGCDGETFEGLPTRPFRHPGPCAEDR